MLRKNGIVVVRFKEYLKAVKPTEEVQVWLNISVDTPVLKRVKNTESMDGNFREYTEGFYIGENYRYYNEFTKKMI